MCLSLKGLSNTKKKLGSSYSYDKSSVYIQNLSSYVKFLSYEVNFIFPQRKISSCKNIRPLKTLPVSEIQSGHLLWNVTVTLKKVLTLSLFSMA